METTLFHHGLGPWVDWSIGPSGSDCHAGALHLEHPRAWDERGGESVGRTTSMVRGFQVSCYELIFQHDDHMSCQPTGHCRTAWVVPLRDSSPCRANLWQFVEIHEVRQNLCHRWKMVLFSCSGLFDPCRRTHDRCSMLSKPQSRSRRCQFLSHWFPQQPGTLQRIQATLQPVFCQVWVPPKNIRQPSQLGVWFPAGVHRGP